jgi:hypothetical protein
MSANEGLHLFCTYADDVRQEVGGKLTYVGVYQGGGLLVHGALPIVMPQLAIIASLFCPANKEVKSIKIRIKFNDDLILPEMDVPSEVVRELISQNKSDEDAVGRGLQFVQIIQPLTIKELGQIRCQAEVDGELVRGNCLDVQVMPLAS